MALCAALVTPPELQRAPLLTELSSTATPHHVLEGPRLSLGSKSSQPWAVRPMSHCLEDREALLRDAYKNPLLSSVFLTKFSSSSSPAMETRSSANIVRISLPPPRVWQRGRRGAAVASNSAAGGVAPTLSAPTRAPAPGMLSLDQTWHTHSPFPRSGSPRASYAAVALRDDAPGVVNPAPGAATATVATGTATAPAAIAEDDVANAATDSAPAEASAALTSATAESVAPATGDPSGGEHDASSTPAPSDTEPDRTPATPKKPRTRKKAGRPSRKGKGKAKAKAASPPPDPPTVEPSAPEDEDLADVRRAIALSLGFQEAPLPTADELEGPHAPLSPTAGPSRVPLAPRDMNSRRSISPLNLYGDVDSSVEDAINFLAAAGYNTTGLTSVGRLHFGSPLPSSTVSAASSTSIPSSSASAAPHQNASPPDIPSDAESAPSDPHSDADTVSRTGPTTAEEAGHFVPMSPQPPPWRNATFALPPRLFRNGVAAQLQIVNQTNPPRTQVGGGALGPHYTATPEDGWPVVHWADVAAPFLGQLLEQVLAWEDHPGFKLIVQIFGYAPLDGQIHPPLLNLVNLVSQEIHAFLGTTSCRLCPPIPQGQVTRLNTEPLSMLLRGLTDGETDRLITQGVLSTATISVAFYRWGFSIPHFMGFLTGFSTRDESEVYNIVRSFLDRHLAEIMHIVNDNPLVSQAIVLQPLADRIVSSLRVSFLDVRGRFGVPNPHFRIYLDLPVDNHASFSAIRDIFLRGPWHDSFAGVGRFNIVHGSTCGLCHGSDHPRGLCPFLSVPGWQGPGAAPDNNHPPPPPPPPGPGGPGPFNRGSKRRGDDSYNDRRKFPRFG
ncbi:hypothetical protein EIP86_009110 [Pleurotus ostreatoroseus]|nr:hypothetical protein EIP86_009110 [Pleurotus ostreatoroseus]